MTERYNADTTAKKEEEGRKQYMNWIESKPKCQHICFTATEGIEMVFFKNDATTRDLVRVMTQTESIVNALKNTGQYVLIGELGLKAKDSDSSSGKAKEDFNGVRINLGGKQGYAAVKFQVLSLKH